MKLAGYTVQVEAIVRHALELGVKGSRMDSAHVSTIEAVLSFERKTRVGTSKSLV